MYWKDVQEGHIFVDGSKVTETHTQHLYECYEVEYGEDKKIVVSKDHIFLCDISNLPKEIQEEILSYTKDAEIPLTEDIYLKLTKSVCKENYQAIQDFLKNKENKCIKTLEEFSEGKYEVYRFDFTNGEWTEVFVERTPLTTEPQIVSDTIVWLPVEGIAYIYSKTSSKIFCNNLPINSLKQIGKKKCFCVSTDTGRYEVNGLISHNSVAVRNVIFHCIQHLNEISCVLIDIKQVEFISFKGMNGVLAVANTVKEAAECLRIARRVMYKRNKEMQEKGIVNMADYVPQEPSGRIWITGREYNETDTIKVRIDGEEKTMTAKEVCDYLYSA